LRHGVVPISVILFIADDIYIGIFTGESTDQFCVYEYEQVLDVWLLRFKTWLLYVHEMYRCCVFKGI